MIDITGIYGTECPLAKNVFDILRHSPDSWEEIGISSTRHGSRTEVTFSYLGEDYHIIELEWVNELLVGESMRQKLGKRPPYFFWRHNQMPEEDFVMFRLQYDKEPHRVIGDTDILLLARHSY